MFERTIDSRPVVPSEIMGVIRSDITPKRLTEIWETEKEQGSLVGFISRTFSIIMDNGNLSHRHWERLGRWIQDMPSLTREEKGKLLSETRVPKPWWFDDPGFSLEYEDESTVPLWVFLQDIDLANLDAEWNEPPER